MADKRTQIMEAALSCFAEQGYNATSIQQIADKLGIAKGSLYFYFKSKEDLLASICRHYIEAFIERMHAVLDLAEGPPRDRLESQIVARMELFASNRDFISLFMKERFEINEEIHRLLQTLRFRSLCDTRQLILELYGPAVLPYSYDAASIVNAIVDGQLGFIALNEMSFDYALAAGYIVERLDDLVAGLLARKPKPLLDPTMLEKLISSIGVPEPEAPAPAVIIQSIRSLSESIEWTVEAQADFDQALSMLEQETASAAPRKIVVKGMLAILKGMRAAELRKPLAQLEAYERSLS